MFTFNSNCYSYFLKAVQLNCRRSCLWWFGKKATLYWFRIKGVQKQLLEEFYKELFHIKQENLAIFAGKHLCRSLFFNKVAKPATLSKIRLRTVPVNVAKFSITPILQKTPGRLLLYLPESSTLILEFRWLRDVVTKIILSMVKLPSLSTYKLRNVCKRKRGVAVNQWWFFFLPWHWSINL